MISAYICAPLFKACSSSSSTTTPAPSPMTKPFLSLSNGIEALLGSVDVERAVSAAKPPIPIGDIELSVPPANITSASPCCILL